MGDPRGSKDELTRPQIHAADGHILFHHPTDQRDHRRDSQRFLNHGTSDGGRAFRVRIVLFGTPQPLLPFTAIGYGVHSVDDDDAKIKRSGEGDHAQIVPNFRPFHTEFGTDA